MAAATLTEEVTASYDGAASRPSSINLATDAPDIERALAQVKERATTYDTLYRYYCGEHRLVYATDKFKNAFGDLFFAVADNLCGLVVDSIADRLEVTGFGVEGGAEDAEETRKAAWEIWQSNRMDERACIVHQEALAAGDGYVLVWPDPDGRPVIWPQKANLMTVYYDEERPMELLWAAKVWMAKKRVRVNLYYRDRIEKYVTRSTTADTPSRADQFERFQAPGEPWPLPNPWETVPVFHFRNGGWLGSFGKSELIPVRPLQDALNKALCDMLVAMEYAAFQQRWATGIEYEIDEKTGKPIEPFKAGIDRLWTSANEAAKFGQFDTANLEQFLKVQESLRVEISRVVGLPPHYVQAATGANMSGEALKTAEARLVKKVVKRQGSFGNAWENAMSLALRMAQKGEMRLSTEWTAAAPVSQIELLNSLLVKKELGATTNRVLEEAGYSEKDIQQMELERERVADTQRRRFDSGLLGDSVTS